MGKLTKSIEIEASPEKVFTFINDIKKMNEIGKGFVEGEDTSEGPVGVGSTVHFVARGMEYDVEVTEFVKNKKKASRTVGAGKVQMTQSWTLEPTAKGTMLTYNNEYELPYSVLGKLIFKLKVSKDLEKSVSQTLENMKKALEA